MIDLVDSLTRLAVASTSLVGAIGTVLTFRQARRNGVAQAVTAARVDALHTGIDANHAETVGKLEDVKAAAATPAA